MAGTSEVSRLGGHLTLSTHGTPVGTRAGRQGRQVGAAFTRVTMGASLLMFVSLPGSSDREISPRAPVLLATGAWGVMDLRLLLLHHPTVPLVREECAVRQLSVTGGEARAKSYYRSCSLVLRFQQQL